MLHIFGNKLCSLLHILYLPGGWWSTLFPDAMQKWKDMGEKDFDPTFFNSVDFKLYAIFMAKRHLQSSNQYKGTTRVMIRIDLLKSTLMNILAKLACPWVVHLSKPHDASKLLLRPEFWWYFSLTIKDICKVGCFFWGLLSVLRLGKVQDQNTFLIHLWIFVCGRQAAARPVPNSGSDAGPSGPCGFTRLIMMLVG